MTRVNAWTIGYKRAYDVATFIPSNAKAPGGFAFPSKHAAEQFMKYHPEVRRDYAAYEIVLPTATYAEAVTTDYLAAAVARHDWHRSDVDGDARPYMAECGICLPRPALLLDHDLLLVAAPFVNAIRKKKGASG